MPQIPSPAPGLHMLEGCSGFSVSLCRVRFYLMYNKSFKKECCSWPPGRVAATEPTSAVSCIAFLLVYACMFQTCQTEKDLGSVCPCVVVWSVESQGREGGSGDTWQSKTNFLAIPGGFLEEVMPTGL